MALNKWMGIGNVGADPDVRYLENNSKVASFRLACSERYTDRNGEKKENTEWVPVVVFGKPADFVENYVKKGSQLYVEGKLRTRVYKDKSGADRAVTEILADNVQMLGSRQGVERPFAPAERPMSAPAPAAPAAAPAENFEPTDDLPFNQ